MSTAVPDFTPGPNTIADPDIRRFADLARFYPLPGGFVYEKDAHNVPAVVRLADRRRFHFLIEEGYLTFDEPAARPDGRTVYRTTEVRKVRP